MGAVGEDGDGVVEGFYRGCGVLVKGIWEGRRRKEERNGRKKGRREVRIENGPRT